MPKEKEEYEIVSYGRTNFKFSMVSVDVGPLHMHREMELSLLLYGEVRSESLGETLHLHRGDFWINNTMKSHQTFNMCSVSRSIVLHLQILPEFFQGYYPELDVLEFPFVVYNRERLGDEAYCSLVNHFLTMALLNFRKEHHSRLMVAGLVNLFFYELLEDIYCEQISKESQEAKEQKILRLRFLTDYINEHYSEPLYLTDLADEAGLSMSRLSHIFKEGFGMSFQEYLSQTRCEHAREMLEKTDKKLLDICMECGFSAPKYFNRDFKERYNVTPKEYRRNHRSMAPGTEDMKELREQESHLMRTVIFHTDTDACFILEQLMDADYLKTGIEALKPGTNRVEAEIWADRNLLRTATVTEIPEK